ncbi:PAS domain-containing protein [Gloeocapsopsis crepidinum LEGE 06123]|uniref:histidine kinase n=1 Tax=Gloeocapsopsis crepidinum LEGE 06123 TaxID=588587 RepID=A0ABR9UMJ6_9CHRO|nr:ATP-binding protein [Gloeocapsopsis crepidinum]MBE9189498.1 PAS domain-containing protein [Gloeocapsopsis crepidinum LEGE 06123]
MLVGRDKQSLDEQHILAVQDSLTHPPHIYPDDSHLLDSIHKNNYVGKQTLEERILELEQANQQLKIENIDLRRAEEEVLFLQRMTQAISEATDFHSALGIALQKVCDFTGWKFGEAWIPKTNSHVLEYSPAWYGVSPELEKFRTLSQTFTFSLGVGIPGRVWESKHPEWIQDVSNVSETVCQRCQLVREVGFKAGVGIPIINRNEVLAILIFFMFEAYEEDQRLVEIISTVAIQLGSLIQRKQAEEALRSSVATNRALINALPDLLLRINKEGYFVNFKAAKNESLVIPDNNFVGKHLCEVLSSEIALPAMTCIEKALATGELQVFESQTFVDNLLRYYEFRIVVSAENEVMVIVRDITETKLFLDLLQQQERQLKAILNNIPGSAWLKDNESRYIAVNEPLLKLFNKKLEEVVGKTDYDLFPPDLAQKCIDDDREVLATGKRKYFEEFSVNPDGSEIWFETIKTPIHNENNEIIGTTGIAYDITERKRIERDTFNALKKERELSELKSRFVTMTSHEFRTPLATILSSAELLEYYSHKWSEDKKLSHIHKIQSAVNHMTSLLNDVLLIGKAEAGKLEFNPQPLDIIQFCSSLVEELQISTTEHQIIFQAQYQNLIVCLDEKLLRHILTNLLSNAIKYSPQGCLVHFDLICQKDELVFVIQDEGIGIPKLDQEQLFNSFHRASNVGVISGTGLGLAIVKKSVDLHGGQITVDSEVNRGTTFTVTLPLNP